MRRAFIVELVVRAKFTVAGIRGWLWFWNTYCVDCDSVLAVMNSGARREHLPFESSLDTISSIIVTKSSRAYCEAEQYQAVGCSFARVQALSRRCESPKYDGGPCTRGYIVVVDVLRIELAVNKEIPPAGLCYHSFDSIQRESLSRCGLDMGRVKSAAAFHHGWILQCGDSENKTVEPKAKLVMRVPSSSR
jgi:hypothetical protein